MRSFIAVLGFVLPYMILLALLAPFLVFLLR
jgi:hypothetical protein